jgi:hypothetical protein
MFTASLNLTLIGFKPILACSEGIYIRREEDIALKQFWDIHLEPSYSHIHHRANTLPLLPLSIWYVQYPTSRLLTGSTAMQSA